MTAAIRHKKILEALDKAESLSVNRLATLLNCSRNTIRNDIRKLAELNKLIKVHGGATTLEVFNVYRTDPFEIRVKKNIKEKESIAKITMNYIFERKISSIFMDGSTTSLKLAENLVDCPHKLTVITNFYDIAMALRFSRNVSVFLLGGNWWGEEHCTFGAKTCEELKQYRAHIAVIGCKGFILNQGALDGIYDVNTETASIKKLMAQNASERWLLADSSKFNTNSQIKIFDFKNISTVFSDSSLPDECFPYFKSASIDVMLS